MRFQASGCFSPLGRPASGFERLQQQPIFDLNRGAAGERTTAGKKPSEGPKGNAQSRRALKSRQSTRSKPTPRFNLLGAVVSAGAPLTKAIFISTTPRPFLSKDKKRPAIRTRTTAVRSTCRPPSAPPSVASLHNPCPYSRESVTTPQSWRRSSSRRAEAVVPRQSVRPA